MKTKILLFARWFVVGTVALPTLALSVPAWSIVVLSGGIALSGIALSDSARAAVADTSQVAASEEVSGSSVAAGKLKEIRQLISQLGDEQYLQRQLAETKLIQIGADAFAELQAAENHADLEIVTRSKYIISQIRIEWVRAGDSAAVRSIMNLYGELPRNLREEKIDQLASMDGEQGFGALCRIVRYESSTQIARYAALAILDNGFLPPRRTAAAIATLNAEMGADVRVPMLWVAVYVDQLQNPENLDSRWLGLIDAEIELLSAAKNETEKSLVERFLRSHLAICDRLSDGEAIFANWRRRIDLNAGSQRGEFTTLVRALTWVINHEQWEALTPLEDHYSERIEQERLLVYLVALSRDKQGLMEEAERYATRALSLESDEPTTQNYIARLIGELGRHDWAEREWASLIETLPATDEESVEARESMALLRLNDRGEHQAAADLLDESIRAIRADPVARERYQKSRLLRLTLRSLNANREYFLACECEKQADYETQRRHLGQAIRLAPKNADVLIAMYRLQGASAEYRKSTLAKIEKVKQQMESEIKQSPSNPQTYNQWSWLISNTEGDFAKAVERSERSLVLAPDSPSFMDTLGRCYYAAGELDKAIDIQKQAIAKHPHMMVMQRQLEFFESELAKRSVK